MLNPNYIINELEKKKHRFISVPDIDELKDVLNQFIPEFRKKISIFERKPKEFMLIYNLSNTDNFQDVKESIYQEIIRYFEKHENFVKLLYEYLKLQNKALYLRDFSLILYAILDFLESKEIFQFFRIIFIIEFDEDIGLFQDFFSFIHGCMDFYQLKENIIFFVITNPLMKDLALKKRFPQLYDRFEISEY